jgi:hypothetical protein
MQTVAVGLPARHSIGDRLMRTGFACRHDGFGRRSWEIAQGWPCYLTPAPLPRVPSVRIPDLSR